MLQINLNHEYAASVRAKRDKMRGYCQAYRNRVRSDAEKLAHRKAWEADYKRKNAGIARHSYLMSNYGIGSDQFEAMLAEQNGRCAVCGGPPDQGAKRLSVDHCHASGKVRGLLCHTCNKMIGLAKDSPSVLQRAAEYLVKLRSN